jgi:hypothetical protein
MSSVSRTYESTARDKWQEVLNRLIEFGRNQGQLEDEEMPSPSVNTIQSAYRIAARLRDNSFPLPTRTVPDAHGGIVFELEAGNLLESIRISADGSVEHCAFEGCRMVRRERSLAGIGQI